MSSKMCKTSGNLIWSELPIEILIQIYDKLAYKDSVRFTCVCKNWHKIINREVPWLLLCNSEKEKPWYLVRHGSRTIRADHVYSTPVDILPCLSRVYDNLEEDDFAVIDAIASKRGWLLLTDCTRSMFCCCNVFTSDAMRLPDLRNLDESVSMRAAFSDELTSQNCVIFLLCQITQNSVDVKTFRSGDNNWRSKVFVQARNSGPCHDVVYNKGKFYCIFTKGLGFFDLENEEYHYFKPVMPRLKSQFTTFHLAEFDGEILLMLSQDCIPYFPMWKLDLQKKEFRQVERLGDRAVFISFGSTSFCTKCDTDAFIDKVFYPGSTNSCWFISMQRRSHTLSESYPWITKERIGANFIWIEPPK